MKVNANQVSSNYGGVTNQVSSNYSGVTNYGTSSQVHVPKQEKTSTEYLPKEAENKPKSEAELDEKQLIDVIEKTNKAIEGTTCSFEYSIHEETKQIMVKVVDKETKEVIREFPPEKILDMVAKMWEVAGIMVDERR